MAAPAHVSDEIILGIDPGLGTTGWGIVKRSRGRITYLDSGRIRTRPDMPINQRLQLLFTEIQTTVQRHRPTSCGVEDGYVGRSAQSALKLGQARAAAILAVETLGVPVQGLAPREVKLAITGRGAAAKEQVGFVVGKILGLEFDAGEEDISDALAVALCRALRGAPNGRTGQ